MTIRAKLYAAIVLPCSGRSSRSPSRCTARTSWAIASTRCATAPASRAWRNGQEERTERIFLGPEIDRFRAMAATSEELANYESRRAALTELAFDDARDDMRRRLIAVGLGAGLVIVLLLVTAWDVARLALEGERRRRAPEARG
jgi:hypothetical protein